jgi:hypothetical protein
MICLVTQILPELLQTLHSVYMQADSRNVAILDDDDNDDVEAVWQQLDGAELARESAEEAVAAAKAESEAMANMTNLVDDMIV